MTIQRVMRDLQHSDHPVEKMPALIQYATLPRVFPKRDYAYAFSSARVTGLATEQAVMSRSVRVGSQVRRLKR
jgi:hypothetical protein